MKKTLIRRLPLLVPALTLAMGGMSSCNSSTDTTTEEYAVTISNVAIKEFSLSSDSKVMSDLDSVFFSIDLGNGVIFNADSLPKGSDITKLVPVITFANTVSEADIVMSGGSVREGTVNYLENSTDSIDFSGDVKLNVTAADGTNKFTYTIKVNVHQMVPDSLMWDNLATTDLPSRLASPVRQKSVEKDGGVYTIIEESDGSYTWSSTASIADAGWTKNEIVFPFDPAVESLTVTPSSFWMLDDEGDLYCSADGFSWISTGERWVTLVGPYLDYVLGVKESDGVMMHCHYPQTSEIPDSEMNPEFPIYGRTELRTIESKWTEVPTALFVGGTTATGDVSDHTWAFDGNSWATIDSSSTAHLEGANLFRYTVYRETASAFRQIAYDAWIVYGGKKEDGTYNRNLYVSFDNGVTWRLASDSMSVPEEMPGMSEASLIVLDTTLEADIADAWKKIVTARATRSSYVLDGYDISWKCPYIYVIGGVLSSGKLSDSIWRGVLARHTFTPVI